MSRIVISGSAKSANQFDTSFGGSVCRPPEPELELEPEPAIDAAGAPRLPRNAPERPPSA